MAILGLTDAEATILSAVVAAVVSLAVGLVTYRATTSGHRTERLKLERELQRTMTSKLYEKRMESYPRAWEISDALRRSRMRSGNAQRDPEYFARVLAELDEWTATAGAMILSKEAVDASIEMRLALREPPATPDGYSEQQMERIWLSKRHLRQELRRDVDLLFTEDSGPGLIKPPSTALDQ
jgi:hypothetical protein